MCRAGPVAITPPRAFEVRSLPSATRSGSNRCRPGTAATVARGNRRRNQRMSTPAHAEPPPSRALAGARGLDLVGNSSRQYTPPSRSGEPSRTFFGTSPARLAAPTTDSASECPHKTPAAPHDLRDCELVGRQLVAALAEAGEESQGRLGRLTVIADSAGDDRTSARTDDDQGVALSVRLPHQHHRARAAKLEGDRVPGGVHIR